VRVCDAYVRLQLDNVVELVDLQLLKRAKDEILGVAIEQLDGRVIASLAHSASSLRELDHSMVLCVCVCECVCVCVCVCVCAWLGGCGCG